MPENYEYLYESRVRMGPEFEKNYYEEKGEIVERYIRRGWPTSDFRLVNGSLTLEPQEEDHELCGVWRCVAICRGEFKAEYEAGFEEDYEFRMDDVYVIESTPPFVGTRDDVLRERATRGYLELQNKIEELERFIADLNRIITDAGIEIVFKLVEPSESEE
jgi:hypothetical protein